jgi:catechol 2,3-dioxygenase-like lactoylglutathione lyase family enzyme
MKARLAYVNIFAKDIEKLAAFYRDLFGFAEIDAHRSPIYRCLDGGGIEFGFNAPKAYELLGIPERQGDVVITRAFITIEVDAADMVDSTAERATTLGGRIIKAPYLTYYNARQCVLEDPEGNLFRVNHRLGARTPFDLLPDEARKPIAG